MSDRKMRIIIADDFEVNRSMSEFLVSEALGEDHEIIICNNGQEAYVAFMEKPADIIVTDNDMPIMSGEKLLLVLNEECNSFNNAVMFSASDLPGKLPEGVLFCNKAEGFDTKIGAIRELGNRALLKIKEKAA